MEVRDEYVADTRQYSGPLREAGREADRFGDKNSKAALSARKMGLAAKEAADKAARAMSEAGAAAERLAVGEGNAEEAAQAEAKALREMERAAIKAAEAERATARAADEAADQHRQLARDAELAGAAQRLAALKAAGATKTHNLILRQLEAKYGDLSKEGSGAFKAIEQSSESAFSEVGSSGPGSIALVVGALAAVPFAATAAESAISLGIGGALAGIGLKATASDKEVQAALHNLAGHVKSETKQIAAPFKQTWLDIARSGRDAFDTLVPTLKGDFAELAPVISDFASDAGVAAGKLAPAFDASTKAADKLLGALGDRLPGIAGNVSRSIEIMANGAGKNADQFANLVENVTALLPPLAHVIDYAARFGGVVNPMFDILTHGEMTVRALRGGLSDLTGGLISAGGGFDVGSGSFKSFDAQAIKTQQDTGHLVTTMQIAKLAANEMATAFANASGKTLTEREALVQYRQAIAGMTQALKDNGHAHGFATQKGAANEAALDQMAVAAQKAAAAMKDDGASAKQVSSFLEGARQRIVAAAEKMHYSASEAKALADKLLGVTHAANTIPSGKRINLSDNTSSVRGHIAALQRSITNLHGKTVTIDYIERVHRTLQAERARADGGIDYYADGGMRHDLPPHITYTQKAIYGEPETGGEAFIPLGPQKRERSTELLGQVADMFGLELVKPLAEGAIEKYAKGTVSIGKKEQAQINRLNAARARVTLARSRPEYLAAMAAQQALASMRKSIYGGFFGGGPSTLGSAHGTVVQHVTNVTLNVGGSIRSDKDLVQLVQRSLLTNRMATSLPAGR